MEDDIDSLMDKYDSNETSAKTKKSDKKEKSQVGEPSAA